MDPADDTATGSNDEARLNYPEATAVVPEVWALVRNRNS